jgi:hypothetical protein
MLGRSCTIAYTAYQVVEVVWNETELEGNAAGSNLFDLTQAEAVPGGGLVTLEVRRGGGGT